MSKDFKFTIPLENSYVIRSEPDEATGKERRWLVARGWASDASVDKLKGKMSERCIVGMVSCVNEGSPSPVFRNFQSAQNPKRATVGIDVDHSGHWTDQIGRATVARAIYDISPEMKAQGVEPPIMYVEFEVDLRKSHGQDLQVALDDGEQLGLSIFGKVKRAYKEVNRATGESVEHFDEVDLQRIAITSRPVNNVTWLQEIKRSFAEEDMQELDNTQEAPEAENVEDAAPVPTEEGSEAGTIEASTEAEGNLTTVATTEADIVAPQEEVAPANLEGGELAPDAIADILGLGAPAPEAAPAAVAAPVADAVVTPEGSAVSAQPAPEVETTVQRADTETDEYVSRSVYGAFESETREAIGIAADALTQADEVIRSLQETVTTQAEVIRTLVERMTQLENTGAGRRGSVARSFAEEQSQETLLTEQVDKETRERLMKQLVLEGKGYQAAAMMMEQAGILKLKTPEINDPLLPGYRGHPGAMNAPLAAEVVPSTPVPVPAK